MVFQPKQPTAGRAIRSVLSAGLLTTLVTGCGQDAHHLASIASKLGRQVATGSERIRETALGRLFQNRSVLDQVPLTDRARIRLRLDRSLQRLDISVRQIEPGCLELTGEVPDEAARQAAVQSVQQVPGVEKVADGLKLAGTPSDTENNQENRPVPENAVPQPAIMPGRDPAPPPNPGTTSAPPPPSNPRNSTPLNPTIPSSPGVGGGLPPLPSPNPGAIPPAPGSNPVTIPPPPKP
jgi:hypothetical protein